MEKVESEFKKVACVHLRKKEAAETNYLKIVDGANCEIEIDTAAGSFVVGHYRLYQISTIVVVQKC